MARRGRKGAVHGPCLVDFKEAGSGLAVVFDCKGCDHGSDLSSKTCWYGVAKALSGAPSPSSIILAGYVETEYSGDGLDKMEGIRRIANAARRAAVRPNSGASKMCAECPARPGVLFAGCASGLDSGLVDGYHAIISAQSALASGSLANPTCIACRKSASKELDYLWREYMSHCASIIKGAYGIVEESP